MSHRTAANQGPPGGAIPAQGALAAGPSMPDRRSPCAIDRGLHELDDVAHVFGLVWPTAAVRVRPAQSGACVDVTLGALTHRIVLAPEFTVAGAGLRLVREIFRLHLPDALAAARDPQSVQLAGGAVPPGRP